VTAATEEGIDGVIASRLVSWQKIPKKASSISFLGKARGMPPTFLLTPRSEQAAGRSKHQSINSISFYF